MNQYYGQHYPINLKDVPHFEQQSILELFGSRWMGSTVPRVLQVIKVVNSASVLTTYLREKHITQRRSGKTQVEMQVFKYGDDSGNLFNWNVHHTRPEGVKFLTLYLVLLGRKLRIKEARVYVAPPMKKMRAKLKASGSQSELSMGS